MLLRNLFESHSPEILAIYAGRFHPWHKGHAHVFKEAQNTFGKGNVFVATSNKQDQDKSPFTFEEKKFMMEATGIDKHQIVKVKKPYSAKEIYEHYDPDNTVLVYIIGKDAERAESFTSRSYEMLPEDISEAKPMSQQKYVYFIPTHTFDVMGQPATSATELRAQYSKLDNKQALRFITDLFGSPNERVMEIMDNKLNRKDKSPKDPIAEILGECRAILREYPDMREPNPRNQFPSGRKDKTFGNVIMKGNDGVFGRAFYKANEVIKALSDLDPKNEYDPEVLQKLFQKLRHIKELIQQNKGSKKEPEGPVWHK